MGFRAFHLRAALGKTANRRALFEASSLPEVTNWSPNGIHSTDPWDVPRALSVAAKRSRISFFGTFQVGASSFSSGESPVMR